MHCWKAASVSQTNWKCSVFDFAGFILLSCLFCPKQNTAHARPITDHLLRTSAEKGRRTAELWEGHTSSCTRRSSTGKRGACVRSLSGDADLRVRAQEVWFGDLAFSLHRPPPPPPPTSCDGESQRATVPQGLNCHHGISVEAVPPAAPQTECLTTCWLQRLAVKSLWRNQSTSGFYEDILPGVHSGLAPPIRVVNEVFYF